MRMPPYDAAAICPKCGYDDIAVSWRRNGHRCWEKTCWFDSGEHIHRSCRRCGADWLEAPRDATTETTT